MREVVSIHRSPRHERDGLPLAHLALLASILKLSYYLAIRNNVQHYLEPALIDYQTSEITCTLPIVHLLFDNR